MQEYKFVIVIEPELEADGYNVVVPALPGCFTQGDTIEEASKNAEEAIKCHLAGLQLDGALPKQLVSASEFVSTVSVPAVYA